jgi:hypothetical protein
VKREVSHISAVKLTPHGLSATEILRYHGNGVTNEGSLRRIGHIIDLERNS